GQGAAGVVVSGGLGARRISDDDRGEALAGQVRQVVRCNRLDSLAAVPTRVSRPGCRQDCSGNEDLLECRDRAWHGHPSGLACLDRQNRQQLQSPDQPLRRCITDPACLQMTPSPIPLLLLFFAWQTAHLANACSPWAASAASAEWPVAITNPAAIAVIDNKSRLRMINSVRGFP